MVWSMAAPAPLTRWPDGPKDWQLCQVWLFPRIILDPVSFRVSTTSSLFDQDWAVSEDPFVDMVF